VVHAEDDVAMWAEQLGATAVEGLQPGLNNAVREGVDWARQNGATMAIVAHADLPYATDLRPVAEFDGITLVPDRLRDGTNVICLPTAIDFSFSYGPGSFDIHLETAEATGIPVRVLEDPDLAWDVDHPEDLLPQRQIDQRLVNP